MTRINSSGREATKHRSDLADVLVKGAIGFVTAAIFVGAYLQFELPIWQALVAAFGVFAACMSVHILVRRSERIAVLATDVARLESEVVNLTGRTPGPGPLPDPAGWQGPPATPAPSLPGLAPVSETDEGASGAATAPAEPAQQRDAPAVEPPALEIAGPKTASAGEKPLRATEPKHTETQQTGGASRWPGAKPAAEPKHDYWAIGPSSGTQSEKPAKRAGNPQQSIKSEPDLDAVQGMIKKLAKEVDVAGGASVGRSTGEQRQENALKTSVDALHSAAETMRAADAKAQLPVERARTSEAGPLPPPIAPTHARLSAMGEAISANRIDVFLEPVAGLADAKARHHEVVVSLRDARGAALPGSLRDPALSKTGLTPLLDSARLRRAAEIAASLSKTGRKGSLFLAATAESLTSNQFLDAFAEVYRERQEIAGELVLVFSQSDVAHFSAAHWRSLSDMRDLGFRFGLEVGGDFSLEFTALSASGFAFVKLSADVFRKGLPTSGGLVPANNICRYLGDLSLTVIVGDIDHDAKRATAVDFGAPLGQGPLFGTPKAVPAQRQAPPGHAAA